MASCNSYGWSGGFAALFALLASFLVKDQRCSINLSKLLFDNLNSDHIQVIHYIAIVVGIVLFVMSFFDFASILSEIAVIFIAATIGIIAVGCLMLYAVYTDYWLGCGGLEFFSSGNIFTNNSGPGITIFIFDLISSLLLISSGISFGRIY